MRPAYHIALTAAEKRLIADLAAIQSQIEWLMHLCLMHLLNLESATVRAILGSTSIASNADIWIRVVRERHPFEEIVLWAEYCYGEMPALAKSRNDFLHTLFGFAETTDGDVYFAFGHVGGALDRNSPRVAMRVKNQARALLSELRDARNRAAYLSLAFAHVEWTAIPDSDGSPWLRRLGGPLPPLKGEWGLHKATRRPPPPQS